MRKSVFIVLVGLTTIVSAQMKKIDFGSVDIKYLNDQQLEQRREWLKQFSLRKTAGLQSEIKSVVIQGNKIHSIIYNTGAISSPGVTGNVYDLVWNGLGYGYEFGPLVGAKVPDASSGIDSVKIVIDGFGAAVKSTADGDFAPDGITKWGWLPKPGYSAPGQPDVASWGARTSDLRIRPSSWPESWFNEVLGEYVYPSFLGGNSSVPDEEVYYVVDDSTDQEHIQNYQPMPANPAHGGLGINLEVRTMQFANPLAEDIIFLVYSAENDTRSKELPETYFGMFGDPHIGGHNDYSDDAASFIPAKAIGIQQYDDLLMVNGKVTPQPARNIVYSWDPDGKSEIPTIAPGYFGYKFLESPNNSADGQDNDDDGIIDESPFNSHGQYIDGVNIAVTSGISDVTKYTAVYGAPKPRFEGDENGNWNPNNDDVGVDGIFGTGDYGEGDGVPSQLFYNDVNENGKYDVGEDTSSTQIAGYSWLGSEPNFGYKDVNESDQIGLRNFWSLPFGGNNRPKNDELMYDKMSSSGTDTAALSYLYTTDPTNTGDYIFLYGTGPFDMNPGHRERFSIALLMGTDLKDLLLNSETAQAVMAASYRFAQPPPKPKVTAVAGDGRVTLVWDNRAESAFDAFTQQSDFEGYKIYRSEDFTFSDVFTITDGNGYPFLGKPLYDSKARKSAQWHLPWNDSLQALYVGGFQPVEYLGRFVKYYMGEPSDKSGLVHQYVDSTVTNGKRYYYAVVSYDHGDVKLGLPPTECQAIIQRDAVTQKFKFDVNTVAVVPGPNAEGLIDPNDPINQKSPNVHVKGLGTGKISFKVVDDQKLSDAVYDVTFDTTTTSSGLEKFANVYRATPVVEQVEGNGTYYVNLQNTNVSPSTVRIFKGTDTLGSLVSLTNIHIDSSGGRFRANKDGILSKDKMFTVVYNYYPVAQSTFLSNEDANPIFDGIRPYFTDDTLTYDAAGSTFNSPIEGISAVVGKPSAGKEVRAPLDIQLTFVSGTADTSNGMYLIPGDTVGSSSSPTGKRVVLPFKITNVTNNVALQVFVAVQTKGTTVVPWNFGNELVFITPPEYSTGSGQTMMGIKITKTDTTAEIPKGAIFTAKMKKPFSNEDLFTFTTKALRYDAQKADNSLNDVYVVPNPYVASSQFEEPSYRSDLRGDRAIQFRNLPVECTIRIFTVTGELVQTLQKNDNANYITWDLKSSESARIAYGVYIYQIETPNGGTKIGRLGIIK